MQMAKLFKNGQSQAVRLPKEFRMIGTEVYIQKRGRGVFLMPKEENPWDKLFAAIDQHAAPFPDREPQSAFQERDFNFD